jgi:hypothetical protein
LYEAAGARVACPRVYNAQKSSVKASRPIYRYFHEALWKKGSNGANKQMRACFCMEKSKDSMGWKHTFCVRVSANWIKITISTQGLNGLKSNFLRAYFCKLD